MGLRFIRLKHEPLKVFFVGFLVNLVEFFVSTGMEYRDIIMYLVVHARYPSGHGGNSHIGAHVGYAGSLR